jgi:hypothetical protein
MARAHASRHISNKENWIQSLLEVLTLTRHKTCTFLHSLYFASWPSHAFFSSSALANSLSQHFCFPLVCFIFCASMWQSTERQPWWLFDSFVVQSPWQLTGYHTRWLSDGLAVSSPWSWLSVIHDSCLTAIVDCCLCNSCLIVIGHSWLANVIRTDYLKIMRYSLCGRWLSVIHDSCRVIFIQTTCAGLGAPSQWRVLNDNRDVW